MTIAGHPSPGSGESPPAIADIREAQLRIQRFIHRTPVFTSQTLDRLSGAKLFFKAENLQKVGAFKYRGATHAVQLLPAAAAGRGVATHSSGNHAQALALAASVRGIAAHIVMPKTAPKAKIAAVEGYGARITFCEPDLASREQALKKVLAETGATFIHPFDDRRVIAGQGTAALELLEEHPLLEALIAPVGGGGLLSGAAIAARGLSETLRVFGAEPELADDAHRSLRAGTPLPPNPPRSIADGLLTSLSRLTFTIIQRHVEDILLVSEAEILEAMRLLWERVKIIVEPSGAVPLAAALRHPALFKGLRVGIILSGGNVDLCRNAMCRFWS